MKSTRRLFSTIVLFICAVQAESATTVTAAGCVAESAMQSCLDSANTSWEKCTSQAGSNEEVIACSWGKDVYSCEYQILVGGLLEQQLTPPKQSIPFWPAPSDAPGGCSCNFGQIYENATASVALIQSKCSNFVTTGINDLEQFYGICPGYDLTNFGLSTLDSQAKNAETIGGSCAGLTSSICLGKFGIGSADDGTYLDPAKLPSSGDKALSTTGAELTTPPGGATMTVTLMSSTFTITAAEYTGSSDSGGSSGSDSKSTAATTTGSGSGGSQTSSGASATNTKTGSAGKLRASYDAMGVLGLVAAVALVLK